MRTNKNVKGQALIIAAIFIIIILIFLWSVVNIPAIKTGQMQSDVEVHSQMHTMSNALDAAKLYMETSLEYSTYQACYDNLRKGGWDSIPSGKAYQGYALWDSSGGQPDKAAFEGSMDNSIKSNLALYRGTQAYTFLLDYYVNLPAYNDVVVTTDDNDPKWMFVSAFSDSNLNIQKTQESGEYIRLEKESTLQNQDEYRIDCYGIYRKGAEVYSKTKTAIEGIVGQLNLPSIVKLNSGETLDSRLASYKIQFNDSSKQAAYSLSETSADYDVSVYFISSDIRCTEYEVTADGSRIRCAPEVYVKIEITNIKDDQQFPIYDGSSVIFSPMTLVFVGKYGL